MGRAASKMERAAVKKEVAKVGREACQAKRALAKAKETTVDLGGKEKAIKETGSLIGGTATPKVENQRLGMVHPLEDKVIAMAAGLLRGTTLARAAAVLLIPYLQMIAE